MKQKNFKERATAFLAHALFPNRCIFCQRVTHFAESCCKPCEEQLRFLDVARCSHCGREACGCVEELAGFTPVVCVFPYDDRHKQAVIELKFHGNRQVAQPLGVYLAGQLIRWNPGVSFDWVIPVPMTKQKRQLRGFNQAELLACAVAQELSLPYSAAQLMKVRETKEQHVLSHHARRHNLHDAYAVAQPEQIAGKHILLVDDVYTTGATIRECAGTLRRYDAKTVTAGIICKTVREEPNA